MRPLPDFSKLTFALTPPDFMYVARGEMTRDPQWDAGAYLPWGNLTVSPGAAFMSYGLGIFEGLKALRAVDGRVLLFRPDWNAARFARSAERLTLVPFPKDRFVEVCKEIVRRNLRLVPPADKGSFYLRPIEVASGERLGLGPVAESLAIFYGSPVGAYFGGGGGAVRVRVLEQGRVAAGGTGSAKCMANYAGGIRIQADWKKQGFDDVLYLDARELRYVTETSGSNLFVRLKDGTLVTHPLDDQILPGSTRDATIRLAREVAGIRVEERPIPIDEVIADGAEVFASGTAWTLLPITELVYREKACRFPETGTRDLLLRHLRGIQTGAAKDRFGWTVEVPQA